MAWFGKLFGGLIGFTIAGPLGAVIGAALGHGIDAQAPQQSNFSGRRGGSGSHFQGYTGLNSGEERQSIFFATVFACAGKIAQSDGQITEDEIQALHNYAARVLRLGDRERKFAERIFFEAAHSSETYDAFAGQFYDCFKGNRDLILMVMELQFSIALADGEFHKNEEKLLLRAKEIFTLSETEYSAIRSRFIKNHVDNLEFHYSVLNCKPSDSMDTVKSHYRKLIQEYHPDKIISKGLPEEFITFANKKFDEIQTAYDKIKEARG